MESCLAVEIDVDKVLSKFQSIKEHSNNVLSDLIHQVESLKNELQNGTFAKFFV